MSVLEARNVDKFFPGTVALDKVSLSFESGKIHAFIGKNGSGKSTLLNIFSGALMKDGGEILIDGERVEFTSPIDAIKRGIVTVHQETSLVPGLSVAENVLIGRLPKKKSGLVDKKAMYARTKQLLEELGVDIPVDETVDRLNISQKQMVEIVKAMSYEPKVLQLDEPTSALAKEEVDCLFALLRRLKEKGLIIIYVSHRLQELWDVCDDCTVLRDGRYIGKVSLEDHSRRDIVRMMFGDVEIKTRPSDLEPDENVVLEVRNLTKGTQFSDISFKLHGSEVLGIAGMLGAGRTELLRAIFGAEPYDSGEIYFQGNLIKNPKPQKMKNLGLAMVQEDRGRDGLVLGASILQNIVMSNYKEAKKGPFVKKAIEKKLAQTQIDAMSIKIADMENSVSSLSGGNQQKVVLGKWMNTSPKVMFFDEPSRGIDVNAKQQIFQIIWDLSKTGVGCVMVSSELEELLEVCTRIIIMKDGKFIEEVSPNNLNVDDLYTLCMGGDTE